MQPIAYSQFAIAVYTDIAVVAGTWDLQQVGLSGFWTLEFFSTMFVAIFLFSINM